MPQPKLHRRHFLIGTAVAGATGTVIGAGIVSHDGELGGPPQVFRGAVPWQEGAADSPREESGSGYLFFTAAEQAFITAAVARLIPSDPIGPGAVEAGVPFFLDRQLAGRYGSGDALLSRRPVAEGHAGAGLPERASRPAQLYRAAIAAIDATSAPSSTARAFAKLAPTDQDTAAEGAGERRPSRSTAASTARPSSPCCCRTPRKAISPTRSTAATRTWPPGR